MMNAWFANGLSRSSYPSSYKNRRNTSPTCKKNPTKIRLRCEGQGCWNARMYPQVLDVPPTHSQRAITRADKYTCVPWSPVHPNKSCYNRSVCLWNITMQAQSPWKLCKSPLARNLHLQCNNFFDSLWPQRFHSLEACSTPPQTNAPCTRGWWPTFATKE